MKLKIQRFDTKESFVQEFDVQEHTNLLLALESIKTKQDNSLTYRCGCKSGVCGSCAVSVNGVERLACKTTVNNGDEISPLKNAKVVRDLVIDLNHQEKFLKHSQAYLHQSHTEHITQEDEQEIDRQSKCILCQSCFSSCPVYEVNPNFLGPYALSRSWRYVNDKKETNIKDTIAAVQKEGIWDCTLCGNCTMVCPQFIDPKTDIMSLRMKSVQQGYSDPNMQEFASLNNEFDTGFDPTGGFDPSAGFNPNGF